jgi:hypothetical protein
MPAYTIDLDPIKAHIIDWTRMHYTTKEIASNIKITFGWTVFESTIVRRLRY